MHRAASPRQASHRPSTPTDPGHAQAAFEQLPALCEIANLDIRSKVLESKLAQCSVLFDFPEFSGAPAAPQHDDANAQSSIYSSLDAMSDLSRTSSDTSSPNVKNLSPIELRNREIKRQNLAELIEMVTRSVKATIPESLYGPFFAMMFINLFRPLPPPTNPSGDAFDPTEDEPVLDPSWPHLKLVYELFIRFLESPEVNVTLARRWIDQTFILQLLSMFDVEDPRERDFLKTTLHRIYAKFLQLRAFIRKAIHNVFYEVTMDPNSRHNISEMLEILGSIINGFALPLKDEHKAFLERTLLPLHKTRLLPLYFRQLDYCIVQFIEKDGNLAAIVVRKLLHMWPRTNSTKEVLFLNEMEEVLDLIPPPEFGKIVGPLFRRIALCIDSEHFQVAERALLYWNNEYIVGLISQHVKTILPILMPVLSKHSRSHWNRNVQILVLSTLESFMHMNGVFFDECVAQLADTKKQKSAARRRHVACWQELEQLALSHFPEMSMAIKDERRAQLSTWSTFKPSEGGMSVRSLESGLVEATNSPASLSSSRSSASSSSSSAIRFPQNCTNADFDLRDLDAPMAAPPASAFRRKSVLPVDVELYHELSAYSAARTPSPRPVTEDHKSETEPAAHLEQRKK